MNLSHSDAEIISFFNETVCFCIHSIADPTNVIACVQCGKTRRSELKRAVCLCTEPELCFDADLNLLCFKCRQHFLSEPDLVYYYECVDRYEKLI